ncbi:MAG: DUF1573 domain-containing protein [Candidatus Omnitrophota bacterium]
MEKLTLLICFTLLTTNIAYAVEITPKNINFGEIQQDEVVYKKVLTIKNNEDNTIILKKVRSSCNCITIVYDNTIHTINPNESLKLTLQLNTTTLKPGKFRKYLFLKLEQTKNSFITIEIKGEIL